MMTMTVLFNDDDNLMTISFIVLNDDNDGDSDSDDDGGDGDAWDQ